MTPTHTTLSVLDLTRLSPAQMTLLAGLKVSAQQDISGGSFGESLEAWHDGPRDRVLGLCVLHDNSPVGMTLFKRPPVSPGWVAPGAASIHGLKIALPRQGRGWGHAAFRLAVDALQATWSVDALMLTVDADNVAALAIYRSYGMRDSGPVHAGRNGAEHRMSIALPRPVQT